MWTTARALSWLIQQEPLELKSWRPEMGPKLLPAQKRLASTIRANTIQAWGRRSPESSLEKIPSGDFRISTMQLIVGPHGDLAAIPQHKISAYQGVQWRDIEFDEVEIKRFFPKPSPPSANEWMRNEALRLFDQTHQPGKRDDMIQRCMKEAPCTKREAEAAHNILPADLRRVRGKPPKHSG